ncbi:AlpA family transcriptional regulator [Jeongeupia sp. USM3]|uniref:helix-turn-helix transcriptional regulator n=1 Tax=Jeongeupia sp. USM3 TaxID=1906741 RepID=UPI00089E0697|nr:AlpA family transcriptional regulator [Jeongeupia sp. USM3]AOX99696.1 AlpA family transcriptional regulator [Jeongeupia sp. USM3]
MKIIRVKQVIETTGLARSTIYKYIADGIFPKPIQLGARSVGWVEGEIQSWLEKRVQSRDTPEK